MSVYCGILASGTGQRFSKIGLPKQLLPVAGSALFTETLRIIAEAEFVDAISVAVLPGLQQLFAEEIDSEFESETKTKFKIIEGGITRIESIKNLFDDFKSTFEILKGDIFLLIDANRPLVPLELYRKVVEGALHHKISCPAKPLVDGVAFVDDGFLEVIPKKSQLYSIQTPEACNFRELDSLFAQGVHEKNGGLCEMFLSSGIKPKIVESDIRTYKVTYPGDIHVIEALLNMSQEN